MRILMVAHAFPPTVGGVETHLWDVTRYLTDRGHTVRCLVGADTDADEQVGDVEIVRRGTLAVQALLGARAGYGPDARSDTLRATLEFLVTEQVAHFRPDVVHLHNAHHFAPELAEATLERVAVPVLNSVHDRVGEHVFPEVLDLGWSLTLFASYYLLRALPGGGPRAVLRLAIDLDQFTPAGSGHDLFAALERPVIFHPARLLRWKGVEVSVEAFVRLRRRLESGTLVLCSSDNIVDDPAEVRRLRRELVATARAAASDGHLTFLEFDRREMPSALRSSDIVWYPTLDEEPLGLVPLEAMATGTPIVVSASGGMRETVEHDVTGVVVPRGDAAALADATVSLLRDPGRRVRLVAGGLRASSRFAMPAYVDTLERTYATVRGEGTETP
jgi:glycosyltransferase involved in cell wall biosynthesis